LLHGEVIVYRSYTTLLHSHIKDARQLPPRRRGLPLTPRSLSIFGRHPGRLGRSLASRSRHSHWYIPPDAVITAAVGFPFQYDASIRHITYHLQDKKTENATPYFDMASFQIHKCTFCFIVRSQIEWSARALRGWSITGKALHYLVHHFSDRLSHQISTYDLSRGFEVCKGQKTLRLSQSRFLAAA
jgi:hypothetical protein